MKIVENLKFSNINVIKNYASGRFSKIKDQVFDLTIEGEFLYFTTMNNKICAYIC